MADLENDPEVFKFYEREKLEKAFDIYQKTTKTGWRCTSIHPEYGKSASDLIAASKSRSKLKWKSAAKDGISIPFDGIPFLSAGYRVYKCKQGKDLDIHSKEKRRKILDEKEGQDLICRKRRSVQSKKVGCPATVYMARKIKFPQYKINFQDDKKISRHATDAASRSLRNDIANGTDLQILEEFFLKLPSQSNHQFHVVGGEGADLQEPIDPEIVQRIRVLGHIGVRTVAGIRQHLVNYVENELFLGQTPPSLSRRRYHPKDKDIRNILGTLRTRDQKAKDNQSDLEKKCKEWAPMHPNDFIYYWPLKSSSKSEEKFVFVYQSDWMKRLLLLYGQDLCFMEGTHRTCRSSVPLYFLCVQSNMCYMVVAVFIPKYEDKKSIREVLNILKIANPEWEPRNMISDFCLPEIGAIEECFPDTHIHISEFHRVKAWTEWVGKEDHEVSSFKSEVLGFINEIANSEDEKIMEENIQKLKNSDIWEKSEPLQRYFTEFWELHLQKWVKFYNDQRLHVAIHTNYGAEEKNRWLESSYSESMQNKRLLDLVDVLLTQLLPESYKKYKELNIDSSTHNLSDKNIPEFLHNRPKDLVKHIMDRMPTDLPGNMTIIKEDDLFIVNGDDGHYKVWLGSEEFLPSCQCMDYKKNKLPCKHICTVVSQPEIGWLSLGSSFKEHPLFKLDPGVFSSDLGVNLIGIGNCEEVAWNIDILWDNNEDSNEFGAETNNTETIVSFESFNVENQKRKVRDECAQTIKDLMDELNVVQEASALEKTDLMLKNALEYVRKQRNKESTPVSEEKHSPKKIRKN